MKLTRLAAAAAAMIAGAALPAIAGEIGTVHFNSSGPNCYKVSLKETGDKYAVVYALTPSAEAAFGWMSALRENDYRQINADGGSTGVCGDGTYLVITGVRNGVP